MPKSNADRVEAQLHARLRIATAFVQGDLGYLDYGRAAERLGISERTLKRDIARAKEHQSFEEWRPKRRGPSKGSRRVKPEVFAIVEQEVYANAAKKLNVAKLGRDLNKDVQLAGFQGRDVPSKSTLERLVRDIEAADPAFFARRRHGREGQHEFSVQRGSLETERPLQIVCIDHTVLDQRTVTLGDQTFVLRATATAAIDVHTTTCLAAFVSLFPPSTTTVSLCMALLAIPKGEILKKYRVPGDWEACGLPEILYVDGASDLDNDSVARGCKLHGIEHRVGWPGRPERRARMERLWRTLNSEVHSWEGTTLSNTVELKKHGGQKPPAWNLEEVQGRFLIAAMEYNNETYGSPKIPPIMQWREQASLAAVSRRMPRDASQIFIDFLPQEKRTLRYEGILFENCRYASGDLAKLRYEGVTKVDVSYDPRDVSRLWVPIAGAGYVAIPRRYPVSAPTDLYALRRWNLDKAKVAREKKDSALLLELRRARKPGYFDGLPDDLAADRDQWLAAATQHPSSRFPPAGLLPPPGPGVSESDGEEPPSLAPNFKIPDFKPRLK